MSNLRRLLFSRLNCEKNLRLFPNFFIEVIIIEVIELCIVLSSSRMTLQAGTGNIGNTLS